MSALLPTLQTLAVQNSPEHRRGSANATFFLAMDSSFGLGAILIGFLATALSYADIYRLSALFALASMLAFTLSLYRKHQ
jgi:predicted MFS family arabinose efflux permease